MASLGVNGLISGLKALKGRPDAGALAKGLEAIFSDGPDALTSEERIVFEQESTKRIKATLEAEITERTLEADLTTATLLAAQQTKSRVLIFLALIRGTARPLAAHILFVVIYPLLTIGILTKRIELDQALQISIFLGPYLAYVMGTSYQRYQERKQGRS